MQIVIITRPEFLEREAKTINSMFRLGLQHLHLRKPGCEEKELLKLLEQIDKEYYQRIVLHDHHRLAMQLPLGGIHLNSRNPHPMPGYSGSISCSCHSIAELQSNPYNCNYRTLSPIFDSVSKQGYSARFSDAELKQAASKGIINKQVYALGGVTLNKIPLLETYRFGGAVLLGEPWNMASTPDFEQYMTELLRYQE